MRYLTLAEAVWLHQAIIESSGGASGIRDLGALESALAQPKGSFGGSELYPTIPEKAAALCYSLVLGHPFVDGNKRAGHAAMEVFLVLNGHEIDALTPQQEQLILSLAAGELSREQLVGWLSSHIRSVE